MLSNTFPRLLVFVLALTLVAACPPRRDDGPHDRYSNGHHLHRRLLAYSR